MRVSSETLQSAVDAFCSCGGDYQEGVRAVIDSLPESEMTPDLVADDVVSRLIPRLETLAGALSELLGKTVFTDEDVALIREHVRPKDAPAAVEVAVLAERIRCARIVQHFTGTGAALQDILAGSGMP
jgi:hypothetical protein